MAHPVSGDVPANLARAKRWLRWLQMESELRHDAVICPWLISLEVLPLRDTSPEERARGLQMCAAVAAKCDGIVLVGGRVSAGMLHETIACEAAGGTIADWTKIYGEEPPGC